MRHILGLTLMVLLGTSLAPRLALAQQTSASSIVGVVRDSSGGVLPGVTVEIASPALIEKTKTATTNDGGFYRITDLRPGTYSATFTLEGFGTIKHEEIELPPSFTATVNADMKVGSIEETIVVTGASPLVDVQTVTTALRIQKEQFDAIPASHNNFEMASLMPSVVASANAQDVGGNKGQFGGRGAVHGGKIDDQRFMTDGMQTNGAYGSGNGNGFYMNPSSASDIIVEAGSGGSAEYATSGLAVNLIPKDGGNKVSGSFFSTYSNKSLTGNNLGPDITNRGLTSVNGVSLIYDDEVGVGGPIKRDAVWFFAAGWLTGTNGTFPNFYSNKSANPLLYVPDPTRPGGSRDRNKSAQIRVTWQAPAKNRLAFSANWQDNCTCPSISIQGLTPESNYNIHRQPDYLLQSSWNRPVSNKLLLEAGASYLDFAYHWQLQDGESADSISVRDSATGISYGIPVTWSDNPSPTFSWRAAASYVTAAHFFKTGIYWKWASNGQTSYRSNTGLSYTFNGATPTTITEYASPLTTKRIIKPDMGLYLQDRWRMGRFTVSPGLRFDFFQASVPAQTLSANRFLPERSYPEVDCVPCWKDINPRFALAYDVFGTGKTAVSMSVGRYIAGEVAQTAAANDPATTVVNSVTRGWTDSNQNYIPDCDLLNPNANGECKVISNTSFGQTNVTTHYDPSVLNGWGKRGHNWRTSLEFKHQLLDGLALTAGWYHARYGSFLATDNLTLQPSYYDSYCANAPLDPKLPGGGGYQVCGLYDLNPLYFGKPANNYVTFSSKFGKQSEVYDGFDLNVNARFKGGAFLQGGMNVGNSAVTQVNAGATSSSHTNNCFVVDSPQQLLNCDVNPPFIAQLKLYGAYPLPRGLQVSGSYQNLPGPDNEATWAVSSGATTLGRAFSSGTTVNVPLFAPFTGGREKRLQQIDLRIARRFTFGRFNASPEFDIYNLFNADSVLSNNVTYGPQWTQPTELLQARLFKFGVNVTF